MFGSWTGTDILGVGMVFMGKIFAVAFAASTAAGATVPSIEVGPIVMMIVIMMVIGLLMLMVLVLLVTAASAVVVVVVVSDSGGGGVANVNTSSVHHIGYNISKVLDLSRNVRAKGSTSRRTSFRSRRMSGHG